MPVYNAMHKQTNERTDWKRLNILRMYIQFVIAGIVQFRIQLLLEMEGDLTRRKRQAISNEDIIESVSCIVREIELATYILCSMYNVIA